MIAPAPGVFGYARVPDVDYPVGLYVVAEHKGDEAEPKKWLIARTALESDGDGEGYSAFSRRGREEILWYEWVELAELDPAPPARGTKYVAIDCVNVGDGLDLSSLRAACPDELLRPHEAWASKDDFIGGSPRPVPARSNTTLAGRRSSAALTQDRSGSSRPTLRRSFASWSTA